MADVAAAQAAEMAHMASVRSLESASHSQVSSGGGLGAGGGSKGMAAGVTGSEAVGQFLSNGSLDSITHTGGMDNLTAGMSGAFEQDPMSATFDHGNMSPCGISHEGFNLSNELTKAQLTEATSIVKQTGADIAGNTSIMSQGGGRE